MLLDPERCYRARQAHDARFDGRFFVGVSSTGVYCRPVCTVRLPRRENCRFFPTAAAAESHGFRPCLRCRPELAPGIAAIDSCSRLAQAAAAMIEGDSLQDGGVAVLAEHLGVSDRHLRRVFRGELGVTPLQFAQTQRLLLAKRLLSDTALPVAEVALASGFGSLRRFNALFKRRYRLSPSDLRQAVKGSAQGEVLEFTLAYRAPLDWQALTTFLARRAIAGVEQVESGVYARTVQIDRGDASHRGWMAVLPSAHAPALRIGLSASLSCVVPAVLARVKRLFDLACDPERVAEALGELAAANPGLRVPGAFDGFEAAVRAILGQQISVTAAHTLAGRFAAAFGEPVAAPHAGLRVAFPSAQRVAVVEPPQVAALGVITVRAAAIVAVAREIAEGRLRLDPTADVEATLNALRGMAGIGEWTAQYLAMRALNWPDAFPHSDYGVLKALGEKYPRAALRRAEQWRPWRSYAVMHLWKSLETQ